MSQTCDMVIVGAGIVGAACALECARSGLKVVILERGVAAGGTTGTSMGHIVVMDDSEAQFALTRFSRDLWLNLRADLPKDVEYELCGTLWLAANDVEMLEVRRKEAHYRERGVSVEVLDGAAIAKAEPNLRAGMAGGLRVPGDGVLYPPCATRYLLQKARQFGATLRTGAEVSQLLPEGGVVLADSSRISAGLSVNAAGPWSGVLCPGVPVRKRKGHLVITDRYPNFIKHQIVELGYLQSAHSVRADSVAFNIQPRQTGQMLIGSSRQYDAEDSAVDSRILSRMLARCAEYLPRIKELSVTRVWTGHRPATPDKLPLIGPLPGKPRIWLATGHEGLGITTSVGTGRLLADMVLHRTPAIPVEPYLPSRFAELSHA